MLPPSHYTVVLPAAGIGKRMQADCPKQYLKIAGKSIIEHTISNLLLHPQVNQVVVVISNDDNTFSQLPIAKHPHIKTVIGGKERSDSVLAGLNSLPNHEKWVLVHDAARPCLAQTDLTKLLQLAEIGNSGGILATSVRDTMKRAFHQSVDEQRNQQRTVEKTESRENLWHAMTPQFFPLATLKKALNLAASQNALITDEASAIELLGEDVLLVEGRASNIKVTQPEDLLLAEFYLSQGETTKS